MECSATHHTSLLHKALRPSQKMSKKTVGPKGQEGLGQNNANCTNSQQAVTACTDEARQCSVKEDGEALVLFQGLRHSLLGG